MANRNFANSRVYTGHVMPVALDLNVAIGAAGAVGALKGPYVASVTRLAAGIFSIRMQDKYSKVFSVVGSIQAPTAGTPVAAGSFVSGTPMTITAVGDTDWSAIGLPSDLTPAAGMSFVATGIGAGTGTATEIAASGITGIETLGNPNLTSSPSANSQLANSGGAIIMIRCMGPTSSSDTTPVATDPAEGSVLQVTCLMSNSSVTIQGE